MKLPDKTTIYSNSVLALFPEILSQLKNKNMGVNELYQNVCKEQDFENFVNSLEALYALGKIGINGEDLLYYADRNSV